MGALHVSARAQRPTLATTPQRQRPEDQRVRGSERTALNLAWTPAFAANRRFVTSKPVDGAAHAERTAIEHVRVHHRSADVRVPEQLLHCSEVVAILEQVCCE